MATIDNRFPTEGTQIDIEARLANIETALASLMSDTTGGDIKDAIDDNTTAITSLATSLGTDKANRDASNITDASAWRSAIGAPAQTQVGSGSFKISERYTGITSQYGSINLSTLMNKSVNDCSVFNVVGYSSSYPSGLICLLIIVGSSYWLLIKDTSMVNVANTSIDLYVNYYSAS